MVFSSVPVYLDPPNWSQQQPLQLPTAGASGDGEAPPIEVPSYAAPAQRPDAGMPAAASSARPISMTERARLAKIPQPEQPLKCPRCDSTNTKFCYFNNYSLSQPRHFCKTCRRYWTRGGALRNVPVGGGCRRNKRSKASGSSSKSAAAAERQPGTSSSSSTATGGGGGGASFPPSLSQPGQLPFLASLHNLGGGDYGVANLGLNFTGMPAVDAAAEYQVEQWRLPQIQQFPFLGGLETPPTQLAGPVSTMSGLYHFNGIGRGDSAVSRVLSDPKVSSTSLISQLASVKMEDNAQLGLNLPRHYLGVPGNEQYWSSSASGGAEGGSGVGGGWAADLSVFNSSSSGNIL